MYKQCPLCRSNKLNRELFKQEEVFVSAGKLLNKNIIDENIAKISLSQCKKCGLLFNDEFAIDKIYMAYKSEEYILKKIQPGAMTNNLKNIKENLIKYATMQSLILEVGSGDGILARNLAQEVRQVVTVDPSVESKNYFDTYSNNITHINSCFNKDILNENGFYQFDIIIARHILEHIDTPSLFLDDLISLIKNGGVLYIEVPNMQEIIANNRFYDIFHDHFAYYQAGVIANYLKEFDFLFMDMVEMFNNQHIGLFFTKSSKSNKNKCDGKESTVVEYSNEDFNKVYHSIEMLNELLQQYKEFAIWGAGAHGNTLLNYLNENNREKIKLCFDKDRNKQNKVLLKNNIEVVQPSKSLILSIDTILIASALYEEEIIKEIESIGFKGTIIRTAKKVEVIRMGK